MFDTLEQRRLFSISIVNRVLNVSGSGGADTMYAAWNHDPATASVRVYDGSTSKIFTMASNSFDSVSMYGGSGGDTIYSGRIMTGYGSYISLKPVVTNGSAGVDTIHGSDRDELIYGGSSADELHGNGGWDTIYGEGGADTLWGDAGSDILDGSEASPGPYETDLIYGGTDPSTFVYNTINGGYVVDIMFADPEDSHTYIPIAV